MSSNNPTRNAAIPAIITSHQGIVAAVAIPVIDVKRRSMFISFF
jgi:hypothetical protein